MRIVQSIQIDRPIEVVYHYLRDFSTVVEWDHSVITAEKISAGQPDIGSQFDVSLKLAGKLLQCRYEITELRAPELIRLTGKMGQQTLLDCIELSALDTHRTQLHYQLDIVDADPGLGSKLLKPILDRYGKKTMQTLKAALEPATVVADTAWSEALADYCLLPGIRKFTKTGYESMPNRGLTERVEGKTIVITGPTSGLGLAAACALSRLGARLALVGRKSPRMDEAAQKILDFSGTESSSIALYTGELQLLADTEKVAATLLNQEPRIDCLINNAGALFNERSVTDEGDEQSLALLLLSPWHLGNRLIPRLLQQTQSRVINVASGGMYLQPLKLDDLQFENEPYDGPKAYARAKRGLIAVTEHWARLYAEQGLISHAMHPGWAATVGVEKSLPDFNSKMANKLRDARQGADTIVWLASSTAATSLNGKFWLDRRPHPTAIIPGTAASAEEKSQLISYLETRTKDLGASAQ